MSNRELVLTESAERDLQSILRFTSTEWDEDQSASYAGRLAEAMHRVAQFPSLGVARPDLGASVRMLAVEQHMIVYQATDEIVLELRLLHRRMNAAAYRESQD